MLIKGRLFYWHSINDELVLVYDCYNSLIPKANKDLQSQAALSLLGHCYFYLQEFLSAAECYEKLTKLYQNCAEYKLYWAQCLYNASKFSEALTIVAQIDNPELAGKVLKLESAIKYREEDIISARILVEKYAIDDSDSEINFACLDYKEGNYAAALERFTNATQTHGYQPSLAYSIALCHYQMHDYSQALKFITDIIDRGIKDHPELSIGMITEGMEVSSVGNTLLLHETALVEAFNLKAAIEYNLKNCDAFHSDSLASEALTDMPPRLEEELDPITLHNQALINMDTNPADGFAKLQYLLMQNPFPPETFANLLLLYCKFEYYDLAADVLAENAHLTYKYLSQYLYDYFDAIITQQTTPMDAYNKFEIIANEQVNELRKITKQLQEYRQGNDKMAVKRAVEAYDNTMAKYAFLIKKIVYCLKIFITFTGTGNYEFGISRVIKAMEPYDKNLSTDTWFYCKRCMIATIENLAKHIISIRDSVLQDCLQFLEQCEIYGRNISTTVAGPLMASELQVEHAVNTVTYEARLLKALILEVINN
ncbi:unnamed protein product [Thelazia callipaeda]|uniref:Tetratricopeptide repeat protein 30 n=1 Tax=Thelazia callipaeda TaxID=103827 RepID=A0A0N5D773_THECL|nr:unnamed protein product [Thelazia callipaeda]